MQSICRRFRCSASRGGWLRHLAAVGLLATLPFVSGGVAAVDWEEVAQAVEIRRDTFGIPHIIGEDERAVAFGLGYAQAEDHMEEIARRLLAARGEAALHLGPDWVENDLAMARFDNRRAGEEALEQVSSEFRISVEAFAAGLSYYVVRNRHLLPDWVPVVDGADVMALIRSGAVSMLASSRWVERLKNKHGRRESGSLASAVEGPGSNAFALAGERTSSGAPILLANPHLSWSSLYWEAHITVPGKVDFFGNTLAGYPVLWAGFNDRLGWANTVNAADLDDIFALRLNADVPDHYWFDGEWRPLQRRDTVIRVRDDDGRLVDESRTYWESHLGPVLHRDDGFVYAVKSERLNAPVQFEGFYRLARTRSLSQFREVFRNWPVYSCNFIYADVNGNILYLWHAMLPRRPDDGTDYGLDVPVEDGSHVWEELHTADEMPLLLNPPGGIVQNANNPPWWASPADWIDSSDFPSYYQRGPMALRPQYALQLLGTREDTYSVDDVLALKFDTGMLLSDRVLPDLLAALASAPGGSDLADARQVLGRWDGTVSADARGAMLFVRFWETYSGELDQPFAKSWSEDEPTATPRGLADAGLALKHLQDAVEWMRERHGSLDVPWGTVNRLRLRDLDLPGDGADGRLGTFRVMRYAETGDGKRVIGVPEEDATPLGFGDNWIMLVEFTEPVQAWSVLGMGQSGHWDSPHLTDQLELFQTHQLRPVWYREEEIEANLSQRYRPGEE